MIRDLVEPFGLLAALPPRLTRHGATLVARAAYRCEQLVDRALTVPIVPRGWSGLAQAAARPTQSSVGAALAQAEVVDLTVPGLGATDLAAALLGETDLLD